jgi:hypothetical protein
VPCGSGAYGSVELRFNALVGMALKALLPSAVQFKETRRALNTAVFTRFAGRYTSQVIVSKK